MIASKGYAAKSAKAKIEPFNFERRDAGPNDIVIVIELCGICHSDLYQVNEDRFPGIFPMVPGHEIVGRVTKAGAAVKTLRRAISPLSAAWSIPAVSAPVAKAARNSIAKKVAC